MTKEQESVKKFMLSVGQECPPFAQIPPFSVQCLRLELIEEELDELRYAFTIGNITLVADALADLKVVVDGAAVACGLDLEPIFEEVMRSNMTKLIDGYRRSDGKWMKGLSYVPPDLTSIIAQQQGEPVPKATPKPEPTNVHTGIIRQDPPLPSTPHDPLM